MASRPPLKTPAHGFRPRVFELPGSIDLPTALHGLRDRRALVALDSAAGEPARFGLIGFDPLRVPESGSADLGQLRRLLAGLEREGGDELPGPFHGGFLGALSYDLGAAGERAPPVAPEPWGQPLLVGGLYVDFLVRDEPQGRTWLVLDEAAPDRPPLEQRRRELLDELQRPPGPGAFTTGRLVRHVSPGEHRRRVQRVRELIAAGDLYQANLAHRFSCDFDGHPVDLYLALRRANPAPYMGLALWPGGGLLSSSPELLLEFDGRRARSRPIKGTRPRGGSPEQDRALAAELLASEKDLAELTMIVDLERNDLGRVARPGGVRVEGLPTLRSYARVHHLMADVVAETAPGVGALEVLAAAFPGGSITGAPKLRSMQRIAELEGEGRGFFCGSLGFVDTRGQAAFNILIRTLLWRPRPTAASDCAGELSFRVGGGITFGSDPVAEDLETLSKAAGLIDALAAGAGRAEPAPSGSC